MSLLGKGRRGRRIGLVFAGALLAFQSLAIVGAPGASASTCSFAGGVLTVTSSATETITFQLQGASTRYILINGVSTVAGCPGASAEATTTNTTQINVVGNDTDQTVIVAMFDELNVTRSWGAVNWTFSLGGNTAAGDQVAFDNTDFFAAATIAGGPGDGEIDVTLGASGIDLNTDADIDATVSGAEGTWVFGSTDDDTIWGAGDETTGGPYTGKIIAWGGDGEDDIAGGAGDDCLSGGPDAAPSPDYDYVDYSAATSSVIASLSTGIVTAGGLGVDTLVGNAGPVCNTLPAADAAGENSFEDLGGSAFNDTLTGDLSPAGNTITPGAGDDTVSGAPVAGDTGVDFIDYSDSAALVTVDMSAGTATGNGNDTFTRIEGAYGSEFNDSFIDDIESDNEYYGDDGNDTFDQGTDPDSGDGDADVIDGESGTDLVDYSQRTDDLVVTFDVLATGDGATGEGEADDVLHTEDANLGTGDDNFIGNAFNNVVNPGGGQNVLDGGGTTGGSDTLDYHEYAAGVEVNMAGGSTAGDSAMWFENVRGSSFDDFITGNELSNTIKAAGGKDNVRGGGGDDTVKGGADNDLLRGGSGDDDLFGAAGNDKMWGGGGTDFCKGGKGKDKAKQCESGKA